MGILNEVLRYKEYKDAQDTQKANAIPNAINSFLSASQQAQQMQNQSLLTQISAAKSGFRIENGQLVQDPNLMGNMTKNVYTIDENGGLVPSGTVGARDRVIQKPQSAELIREKAQARSDVALNQQRQTPTAEMKNLLAQSENALKSVDRLEELASQLPGGYEGMVDIAAGKVTRGKSDPKLMQYLKENRAVAASLYRGLTGDNRLSDEDAASRAYPLVWNPTEDASLRPLTFQRLRTAIKQNMATYQEKIGGVPSQESTGGSEQYEYRKGPNGKMQRRLVKNG